MQILATLGAAAVISLMPALGTPIDLIPVDTLSVSAGGVTVELAEDGLSATAAKGSDFSVTLTLKDGSPIRVRL